MVLQGDHRQIRMLNEGKTRTWGRQSRVERIDDRRATVDKSNLEANASVRLAQKSLLNAPVVGISRSASVEVAVAARA